ncbi:18973_t:CDS:2 [Funneliformis geosporum]|nr:18973_t:CDS:2 [Funneliformis geosporum]
MKKIFTPNEQKKLQELIAELKKEEGSLISSASSKVNEIINEHKKESIPLHDLNIEVNAPSEAEPECFSQSYISFEQMLRDLEQHARTYDEEEIKGFFSKALEELEKLAKKVKDKKKSNETKKEDTTNLGEEKVKNETPPEKTPNQNQSEGDKNVPTDSKEKSEGQNNSENNENTNEPNNTDFPNLANLQTLKTQAISEITTALNQIPPLTSSDLSSEYQN